MKTKRSFLNGRKHCGKRRNCLLQAISPFPTVFPKNLYSKHVKTRTLFGKVLKKNRAKTIGLPPTVVGTVLINNESNITNQ